MLIPSCFNSDRPFSVILRRLRVARLSKDERPGRPRTRGKYGFGGSLGRQRCLRNRRNDHGDVEPDQFRRKRGKSVKLPVGETKFDEDVAALDVAKFA
jgi:hypothetical protein